MLEKLKEIDFLEVVLFFIASGIFVGLIIISCDEHEKNCVNFYKQNHYISETCEKYSSKLKELK